MNFKNVAAATALSAAMVSPAAMAQFSGNVGIFSDYVFRGLSETDGAAAVQGGIDYEHGSGLYAGTWFSTVGGGQGSMESNVYAGMEFDLGGIDLDVGVLYYYFRDEPSGSFVEPYVGFGLGPIGLTFAYAFDYLGGDDDAYFITADYELPLTETVGLGFFVNWNGGDGVKVDNDDSTYIDYGITLTKALPMDFEFSIGLIGNTLKEDALNKEIVVVGLSKSFGL